MAESDRSVLRRFGECAVTLPEKRLQLDLTRRTWAFRLDASVAVEVLRHGPEAECESR